MTLFVREYSWMWEQLKLSLAECRVYAYIYGISHGEKGGYNGSKRHLAELLGLDAGGVKKILDTLTEKHLIVCTDGLWHSVESVNTTTVESVNTTTVESVNENADSVNESVESVNSPHTPLYKDNNKNKTSDMKTDFEKFFDKFSAVYRNRFAATQLLWDHRSKVAQDEMWNEVKDEQDFAVDKNPYFFVQNYREPQPVFLRGDETGDIVQVRYNGAYKLCTRDTMERFNLEFVRDW